MWYPQIGASSRYRDVDWDLIIRMSNSLILSPQEMNSFGEHRLCTQEKIFFSDYIFSVSWTETSIPQAPFAFCGRVTIYFRAEKIPAYTPCTQDAARPLLNARARTRWAAGRPAGRVERLALEKKVKWRYAPFGWAQCLRTVGLVSRWSRSAARPPSGQPLATSMACFFKSTHFAVTSEGTKESFQMCVWGIARRDVSQKL